MGDRRARLVVLDRGLVWVITELGWLFLIYRGRARLVVLDI